MLVSPVDARQLALGNFALPVLAQRADYVIVKDSDRVVTGTLREQPWFGRCYRPIHKLADLTLYQRVAELPPPEPLAPDPH